MASLRRTAAAFVLLATAACSAAATQPDARAVHRWKSAWRYPQAGWIVVHIEGEPYERGLQHGHLLASEIAAYVKALAEFYGPQAPKQAWDDTRRLANVFFLHGFPQEQLQEMKGIADGAAAEGAMFEKRPIDLVDIVALNVSNEIDSLDAALDATPTGLEDLHNPVKPRNPAIPGRRRHTTRCSAFAAVGPATRDGKIVFGHVTMFDLYPANYYNVWIDLKPHAGFHFAMQTTPGGIQSGMDYAMNEAGLLLSETTLDQTRVARSGIPLAARIRTAQQYADSIEKAADMLTRDGNGLSTTEWVLADIRRNEIALLTLGTQTSKLHRSSRKEWFANAEGFYWSDNNTKDLEVRLQTIPGVNSRPSIIGAFAPSKRDAVWLKMYDAHKGSIDAEFGREVLTTPELVAAFAVDAKYTTSEMAGRLETWASFGPPAGGIRRPTSTDLRNYTAVKPLISNPWTVLTSTAPPLTFEGEAADRPNLLAIPPSEPRLARLTKEPAWHGTLIPATDADIWLTTGFANYERIVAVERNLRLASDTGGLDNEDLEEIGVELAYYRSLYAHGARTAGDFPLAETHASMRNENWYQLVTGKGVLLLDTLRGIVGAERFDELMDQYGRANGGKPVATADFAAFLEKNSGKKLAPVFDWWLHGKGLPHLAIRSVDTKQSGKQWKTTVDIDTAGIGPMLPVRVSVETESEDLSKEEVVSPGHSRVVVATEDRPAKVTVDKYGLTARDNGSPFTILTFDTELEQTLIVYGTADEETGNHEAARVLQQSLRRREHNVQPAVKADREVTEADLRTHNLVLVGRPATNSVSAQFAEQFPVRFGTQSFDVRDEVFADPETAVIAAADNPLNPRYELVLMAGLSSLGTLQIMPQFEDDIFTYAPIVILPKAREEVDVVAPVKELTREIP